MGMLRLVLALLIASAHLLPRGDSVWWTSYSAIFAVKASFVISGFYMALVFNGRYRDRPVRDFYVSRALRLVPVYWLVSVVTIVAAWVLAGTNGHFYPLLDPAFSWSRLNLLGGALPVLLYLAVTLTTLFGADTWLWLGFNARDGRFSTAPDYGPGATSALALSFVPQAWVFGLQIVFYLLAPFLVARRVGWLLGLAVGSLIFRAVIASYGLTGDPWSQALLPSELVFFLAGILSYRVYTALQSRDIPTVLPRLALGVALGTTILVGPSIALFGTTLFLETVPFVVLAASIALAFSATRDNEFDAYVGSLSYPVYIVHLLVYGIISQTPLSVFASVFGTGWRWLILNLVFVVLVAYVLDVVCIRRLNRLRARFGARAAMPPTLLAQPSWSMSGS